MNVKKISMVVAVANNNVIGNDNQLLWHLPNDLKHFKALTMSKPIIMGRKTFVSIGKPLPGRQNIVLTQEPNLTIIGCDVAHSVEQALALAQDAPEVMIIGGGEIYRLFYPLATCLHITYVNADLEGDTTFMDYEHHDWQEVFSEVFQQDDKHRFAYRFVTLLRK